MELVNGRKLQLQQQQHFHVLAVDDSVIDRKLLERLLTGSSCKVTCVESGDKALKYLGLNDDIDNTCCCSSSSTFSESLSSSPQPLQHQQGMKVNLIMTDYCMPGMSGYDLLKRLKESSWKDVPVVIMSSENVASRITMCMEGGAEEFLLKPLQISDLKKLQPYFLKSLETSSCEEQQSPNSSTDNSDSSDNDSFSLCSNNSNNNNNNNNSDKNNNIIISKRKAMSPEPPPERSRPKRSG